jgi:hypothetical protein
MTTGWKPCAAFLTSCLLIAAFVHIAFSGVLTDTPTGDYEGYNILYLVTGVNNDNVGNDLIATVFHCTNCGDSNANVVIQIADVTGTDVYTAEVNVASNRTWTFATQNPPIMTVDTLISTEIIQSGSARILSDSSQIMCVVQLIDPVTTVPKFITNLPLYRVQEGTLTKVVVIPLL